MVGFVIPIKPSRFSKNWEYDNFLLERTLNSILQQTDSRFKIFIVYNEKPSIKVKDEVVYWIQSPFDIVESESIADYENFVKRWYNPDYARKMFDKGRKIMLGCKHARAQGCSYIMAVDSDDLVSSRIVSFVNDSSKNTAGWIINKGFMHFEDFPILIKNKSIQKINGSTHIVRSDLVKIPDMNSKLFTDFNFFESHGYLAQRIIDEYHLLLEELPFYGVMYIIHKNNSSDGAAVLSLKKLKTFVKFILFGKFLSRAVKRDFGFYQIKEFN